MDKDILRIVIITLGVLTMLGMVIWHFFQSRKSHRNSFYNNRDPLGKIDDSLIINTENDDFDVVPLPLGAVSDYELSPNDDPIFNNTSNYQEQEFKDYAVESSNAEITPKPSPEMEDVFNSSFAETTSLKMDDQPKPKPEVDNKIPNELEVDDFKDVRGKQNESEEKKTNIEVPSIIQIHVFALDYDGFKGKDLLNVFKESKLEYGSVKIFERLDENRKVDFAVASMVEPGTFPDTNIESFSCPGVVFFLQPAVLDNPLKIFDEFITTIDKVASKLDGVKLDQNREPLSTETIRMIRKSLSA
ncbi:MAG: hypothetical protein KAH20_09280 [Methylococcales bacterium]|nr:hypothetical protein [Methylococcales bacterium]